MNTASKTALELESPAASAAPAKILLVDDLDTNLLALTALLQQDGVELFHALSGTAALELLLIHDFALAIIDVQMPIMNGFELAALMRGTRRTRHIPIIFITAGAQNQQNRFQGYEAGAVDFLYKPLEPDILRLKAAVFLELYRSRQEIMRQRDELKQSERRLAVELNAVRRLQELSTRLIDEDHSGDLDAVILETAVALTGSDSAMLHLLEPGGGVRLSRHHGLPQAEVERWHEMSPESAPFVQAVQSGRRVLAPVPGESPDPRKAPVILSTPLRSRSGALLGAISTIWRAHHEPGESELRALDIVARQAADVIERSLAIRALRQTTERLRFMAESMPQKIFTANAGGAVDYCNAKWTEFTSLPCSELAGSGWIQCIHPDDRQANIDGWRHAVESGHPFEIEHRLKRRDGVYRWHLCRAHALRNESGEIIMWIGSDTEIHSQKEIEANLRRSNEDLNHFAFAASHDLQEPLRMIACYSSLLVESCRPVLKPEVAAYTKYVQDGTKRMKELLADLLSYTEVTQDVLATNLSVDLNCVIQKVLQNLEYAIQETGAEVSCENLPQVRGNESHFVQLFQNLIGNALKYRSSNAPRVCITVTALESEWRFAVRDNGIGIAPEYHERIFGVFKRLHGKAIPGTGIGLSICQRVVERYGGRIWVDSQMGSGATFYFTLPAEPS